MCVFRALKKHSASVCALLKRQVFSFRKDSAELLSALLDFLRQILNTDPMVEPQASPYQHDQPLLTWSTIICRCEGRSARISLICLCHSLCSHTQGCCGEESGGEESGLVPPPRSVALTGSEMKALLQWEETDTHPLNTLEKHITVHTNTLCIVMIINVSTDLLTEVVEVTGVCV